MQSLSQSIRRHPTKKRLVQIPILDNYNQVIMTSHKKSSSLAVSKKEKTLLAKSFLKKGMIEINNVQSMIGKQSVKWTFPKANRFSTKLPEKSAEYQTIKTSIGSGRKAGFGYGTRWTPSNPRGKDAPPSTTYSIPGIIDQRIIGGKISPSRHSSNRERWSSPGPGTYNVAKEIGRGITCTLKSRHSVPNRFRSPPPGTYDPRHSLVESSRFSNISFGVKTSNENFARFATPGPGSYDLASTFTSLSPSPSPKRQRISRKNSI